MNISTFRSYCNDRGHEKTEEAGISVCGWYVDGSKGRECRNRKDLVELLTVVIRNSTVIPFKWHGNKFMCFFCCCPFDDSSKLKQHTKEEHEGARLKNVLQYTVRRSTSIKLDVSELSCKKCGDPMPTLDEFLQHISYTHQFKINIRNHCLYSFILSDDDMNCLECGMSFRFFGPLIIHTHKYHSRTKPFLCEVCGQGFIARANVESHRKNAHATIGNFPCKDCDKTFPTKHKLTLHVAKEHSAIKCPKCPEVLASKYLKKRHLAFVHDVKSAQYKCEQCPKMFFLKNKLLQHKHRVHLKEKNFACEICGFKVFSKDLLKRHMVKHDDARPFECDICKKAFQRKKTLDFHRRIHTNDKRYQCKECGRSFVQWTSLKLHLRVHHSNNTDTNKQKPKTHDVRVPTQQEWEKAAARRHVHAVLANSSLLPFRWRGNRYICFYCYQTFHEATALRAHSRADHRTVAIMKHLTQNRNCDNFSPVKVDVGEILTCLKCNHQELTLDGLIEHLKGHKLITDMDQECFLPFKLADKQISCLRCGKSYQFFGMLYSHMNKVHLEGTKRICEACGQHFFSDFSLRKHVQIHHVSAEFKCSRCPATFKLDSNKVSHEFKEHNIKSFKCYKCDEIFGSQYLRRLHMNGTHLKADFTCPECSKAFLHKSLLTRHVARVHLKEKSFSCPLCAEKFFDLPTLNMHTKKHSGITRVLSYQCKVCMVSLESKVELDDHMASHSGQSLSLK